MVLFSLNFAGHVSRQKAEEDKKKEAAKKAIAERAEARYIRPPRGVQELKQITSLEITKSRLDSRERFREVCLTTVCSQYIILPRR